MDSKIKEIIKYFEEFNSGEEFYAGDIIRTIKRIDEEHGKILVPCDKCRTKVDMNTAKYDWDFSEDGRSKIEWFICPNCGHGDMNVNVTHEG